MANHDMNKDNWVAMFEAIGLDDKTMMEWHRVFERQHPESHQAFLQWLHIPEDEIRSIRAKVR